MALQVCSKHGSNSAIVTPSTPAQPRFRRTRAHAALALVGETRSSAQGLIPAWVAFEDGSFPSALSWAGPGLSGSRITLMAAVYWRCDLEQASEFGKPWLMAGWGSWSLDHLWRLPV